MTLIHCTQKLLKELGKPPLQTPVTEPNPKALGDWYANLLLMRGSRHLHPIKMLQELLTGEEVPRPRAVL